MVETPTLKTIREHLHSFNKPSTSFPDKRVRNASIKDKVYNYFAALEEFDKPIKGKRIKAKQSVLTSGVERRPPHVFLNLLGKKRRSSVRPGARKKVKYYPGTLVHGESIQSSMLRAPQESLIGLSNTSQQFFEDLLRLILLCFFALDPVKKHSTSTVKMQCLYEQL